ncbi:DMT family transporter [Metasolibacillus sp.]|uniref:DMT family transporter n=1 Tax=Metasolibacillus sp. TaxID=2703680 RepID=UPI0025F2CDB0|nr:DMT family transporter [Metasolibacillus sp.]MCT6922658.1 DMT family transporter [Metasolibacillus sp.]MCT6939003.1 DMT family transporter [Metasolibacillus sp.]
MKKYMGDAMMLITAIVWGSGFVVVAIALKYLTAYQVMAGRFLLAAIILLILFGYRLKGLRWSVVWKGAILGTILYIAFAFQTVGLEYTTASKNAFITAVNVVIVPLIAFIFYKRKIDGYEMLGSILALIGIGLLSLQGSFKMNIGDILTLICAVGFAFDIFYTNYFVQKEDALTLTIVQFVTAAVIGTLVVIIQGDIPTTIAKEGMYAIIYLAVFSTTLAYVLQNVAHKYTTATKAAIILSTEALFGTLFAILFLHEVLTLKMTIGAVMIMLAILIAELKPAYFKRRMLKKMERT